MSNPQIEELRKRYKNNLMRYDDIGIVFNCIDTLEKLDQQYAENNNNLIKQLRIKEIQDNTMDLQAIANKITEDENKIFYGAMALIMKKCNIKEIIFTLEELKNIKQNKLITIKDVKTNNLIVKVVE